MIHHSINPTPNSADFRATITENHVVRVLTSKPKAEWENYYKQLAAGVGHLITNDENTVSGELTSNSWTPIEYIPEDKNSSYKHSNTYQPLHTDYGYFNVEVDISFFFCQEQAEWGGATFVISAERLVDLLKKHRPNLLEQLTTKTVRSGRGKAEFSNNEDFILQLKNDGWHVNWNYYRVCENNSASVKEMVQEFADFLHQYVVLAGMVEPIKLKPGEGLFFHDRKVLHGRYGFLGNRKLNKGALITSDIDRKLILLKRHLPA